VWANYIPRVKEVAQLYVLGHCDEESIIDLILGIGSLCGIIQLEHIFALYVLFKHSDEVAPTTVRPSDASTAAARSLVRELDLRSRELARGSVFPDRPTWCDKVVHIGGNDLRGRRSRGQKHVWGYVYR